ncbi:MAG: hypothetical protein JNM46_04465 [Anaerolineales bacterium]|nr:hypothetical protein [Anaerolineales bacterium]
MKYKFSKSKLFDFFKKLFNGDKPEVMSKALKKKDIVENKLRWEDDGGPILETNNSVPPVGDGEKQSLPD